jgi:hypothetical protein
VRARGVDNTHEKAITTQTRCCGLRDGRCLLRRHSADKHPPAPRVTKPADKKTATIPRVPMIAAVSPITSGVRATIHRRKASMASSSRGVPRRRASSLSCFSINDRSPRRRRTVWDPLEFSGIIAFIVRRAERRRDLRRDRALIPLFNEDGLLPQGLHFATLAEIAERFRTSPGTDGIHSMGLGCREPGGRRAFRD